MLRVARLANLARRQGQLQEEDCQSLPLLSTPAATVAADAQRRWAAQKQAGTSSPSLQRVVLGVVAWPLARSCVLLTLRGCGNALVLPLLINYIVEAVVACDVKRASNLLIALLVERILGAFLEYFGTKGASSEVPTDAVTAISTLVFEKSTVPGLLGLEESGVDASAIVGRELITLHSRASQMLPNGMIALPTLAVGIVTLFILLGWSAVFGVVWVLFTIRVGIMVQERAKEAEGKMAVVATERLGALSNVVVAIKAIKYFAWEPEFLALLLEKRAAECVRLQTRARWTGTAIGIGKLTPVTGSLVTFVAYALVGNEIRASTIFAANSVFMTLRFSVGAISFLTELYKSFTLCTTRAEKLLALAERPPRAVLPEGGPCLAEVHDLEISFARRPAKAKDGPGKPAAAAGAETGGEEPGEPAAEAFKFAAAGHVEMGFPGKLTAICGAVGSGKTLLLSALLGHVDGEATLTGEARAVADLGWAPQKPFVISGSLTDNILLGRPFDEQRMARCLADSCFASDVELFADGLDEVVGERGTTLSGGQQARLGLARTLYGEPALLLLDDPFAAVDASVGRALLQALRLRCAGGGGADAGSRRPGAVVVLNQLPLLPNFDHVVFVKDGRVAAAGTFDGLQGGDADFRAFMQAIDLQKRGLDAKQDLDFAEKEAARALALSRSLSRRQVDEGEGVPKSASESTLVKKETTASGFVRWAVWASYLFAPGKCFALFMLSIYIMMYATLGLRDWWMTVWADEDGGSSGLHIGLFVALGMLHVGVVAYSITLLGKFAARAGQNLHSDCVEHLMRAPMSYFDETPSGRITSRLGSDLAMVDSAMVMMLDVTMTFSFMAIMMCVTVIVKLPIMAIVFAAGLCLSYPVVVGLAIFRQDTKRHSNNAMAPILSNLAEVRRGAALVQALGCLEFFRKRHLESFDRWALLTNASSFTTPVSQSWCHFMHLFILAVTGILTFANAREISKSPGIVAMYFSYAALWGIFAMVTIGAMLSLLTNAASLERLVEFKLGELPQEKSWVLATDPAPKVWPTQGAIRFERVELRYRPNLPLALKGLDLDIAGGEKLGIVGRTGAGKSSITAVLFRLVECESGRVVIDGVDVATLGLHTLRKAISMIPQEPIVMAGTVRYNLDPFSRHSDQELLDALRTAGLLPAVALDTPAGGAGAGLSAGQKQLLTFGRTLLQDTRIVMMDEPTASVDMQTDRFVQRMTREAFASRTVLTIAHRLDTVRQSDRIAVLSQGVLVELGPPDELFGNPSSELSRLAAAEGHGTARAKGAKAPGTRPPSGGLAGALSHLFHPAPRAPAFGGGGADEAWRLLGS